MPEFEGLDSYEGRWRHTNRWPKEGLDLAGKRVGVIGTGATADARAFKQHLLRAGELENTVNKPRWKRYNDLMFWIFCAIGVLACVVQGLTGYSLSLDRETVRGLAP